MPLLSFIKILTYAGVYSFSVIYSFMYKFALLYFNIWHDTFNTITLLLQNFVYLSFHINFRIPFVYLFVCFWIFLFFSFFCATLQGIGILVPQPGIEPMPPEVEAQSPSHWTAREFLSSFIFNPHEILIEFWRMNFFSTLSNPLGVRYNSSLLKVSISLRISVQFSFVLFF